MILFNKPIRDTCDNRYTGTDSGNMNNDELIKFIEDIIVKHTQDQPAACLLDSLDYQHNNRTIRLCNKHNITVIVYLPIQPDGYNHVT